VLIATAKDIAFKH